MQIIDLGEIQEEQKKEKFQAFVIMLKLVCELLEEDKDFKGTKLYEFHLNLKSKVSLIVFSTK